MLKSEFAAFYYEANEAVKESKRKLFFKETLPFYQQQLDAIAKENNGHLALGRVCVSDGQKLEIYYMLSCLQLTWADLYFLGLLEYLNVMAKGDITEGCPNLQAVINNVLAIPVIKKWVETRPASYF